MSRYGDSTVLLRAGTVCRYILYICVCQGRYSVGTTGWSTPNVVAISKTIVNSRFGRLPCLCRPSIATQSVLVCLYETCTMTDHWKVGTMVWHCAGLIWTHISFKPRRRDGRGTTVSRIVNS